MSCGKYSACSAKNQVKKGEKNVKRPIYVVTMYRWGSRENHSYIVWVGTSKKSALKAGDDEECERGGNYSAEVLAFAEGKREFIVKRLSPHPYAAPDLLDEYGKRLKREGE